MKSPKLIASLALGLSLGCTTLVAQDANSPSPLGKLKSLKGPAKADMKGIAQIDVPAGYFFLDKKNSQTLLEAMGNLKTDEEVGLVAPTSMVWFVVFEFDPSGYVKDDEKKSLDADALLKAITRGTEHDNLRREKLGMPAMHIVGWEQPPHYNEETHNLEWSIKAESGGEQVLNHNTRLLGRKGVMRVTLVGDPKDLEVAMPEYRNLIATYDFNSGQRYAEYRSGDKVAKYGLAALVVGGAAVGAAKLGLFASLALFLKKAWKLVVLGVAAVATAIKKMFGRLTGRREPTTYG